MIEYFSVLKKAGKMIFGDQWKKQGHAIRPSLQQRNSLGSGEDSDDPLTDANKSKFQEASRSFLTKL